MSNFKQDFPIFSHHPELVYLDSTATAQKPCFVIDAIKDYLEHDYSNIHRGSYALAQKSEHIYEDSKKKVAHFIGAPSWREIIYSFNATYCLNLFTDSLRRSAYFKKGDKVLLSVAEHHANIVPWLILKEEIGIEIAYIGLKEDYSLDLDDLKAKLDKNVKCISLVHVSNVTGEIFDLASLGKMVKEYSPKILFVVDASQSIPHFKVDVNKIGCDALFFTGHKMMADTGIGVLWAKTHLLSSLKPAFSGGGAIAWVKREGFKPSPTLPDAFEPGTPNLTGAVSLLKACEYIENIGGYEKIAEIEGKLMKYTLKKFQNLKGVRLIGGINTHLRVGVFSFVVEGVHAFDIADYMAEENICIRAGQHCAEPFMSALGINNTCRMSLYIYNDTQEIDTFFRVLEQCIGILR